MVSRWDQWRVVTRHEPVTNAPSLQPWLSGPLGQLALH